MNKEQIRTLPLKDFRIFVEKCDEWIKQNPDCYTYDDSGKVIPLIDNIPQEILIYAEMLWEDSRELEEIVNVRSKMGLD